VDIAKSAELDGDIEICIAQNAPLKGVERIDVMKFQQRFGEFRNIRFACSPQHESSSYEIHAAQKRSGSTKQKTTKLSLKEVEQGCTRTEYTAGSFAVLFDGCNSSSNKQSYVIHWLSLAFFIVALICIVIILTLFEFVKPIR